MQITFDRFDDVQQAFSSKDLTRSADPETFEHGNILEGVVMLLHGAEHRRRRRYENPLFRREHLKRYEQEIFPTVIRTGLDGVMADEETDLVKLSGRLAVVLSALVAGVDFDHQSPEQAKTLVHYDHIFNTGVGIEDYTGDPEQLKEEVRATLDAFEAFFLRASRTRRQDLIAAVEAGELYEKELPVDLLTTLLRHQEELGMDDALVVRETAFFLESGAHTSGQTAANAMHHLFAWCAEHPEDWSRVAEDQRFAQRCVQETLRLRPIIPLVKRRALTDTTVAGVAIPAETMVLMDIVKANTDTTVFGDDASTYNPHRAVKAPASLFGHSFSQGIHTCIGRALAAGQPVRQASEEPGASDAPDDEQLLGFVPGMIQQYVRRGAQPHPSSEPVPVKESRRWTRWESYPVRWDASSAIGGAPDPTNA